MGFNWRKFVERRRNQTPRERARSPFYADINVNCEARSHYKDDGTVSDERVYDIFIYPDKKVGDSLDRLFLMIADAESMSDTNDRAVCVMAGIRGRRGAKPTSGLRNELSGKSAEELKHMLAVLLERLDQRDTEQLSSIHVSFCRTVLPGEEES